MREGLPIEYAAGLSLLLTGRRSAGADRFEFPGKRFSTYLIPPVPCNYSQILKEVDVHGLAGVVDSAEKPSLV